MTDLTQRAEAIAQRCDRFDIHAEEYWLTVRPAEELIGEAATIISELLAEQEWQPIETAPRDELILLYGKLEPHPDNRQLYGRLELPTIVTAYWCEIDEAWCPMGSTWVGPWFSPTHWRPLPTPPEDV